MDAHIWSRRFRAVQARGATTAILGRLIAGHQATANVIHAGDTFFNGFYPFIDVSSGGSLDGMIANAKHLLTLADANTKIIPGHGPLGDRAALQVYHDVLVGVRKNVAAAMQGGKSLSEVVKAAPTKPWDATWGAGFLNAETFTTLVYEDLKRTVK